MENMTGIKSLNQIITWAESVKLIIPDLQRDYVWDKAEWRRLWDDVIGVLDKTDDPFCDDPEPQHFTGILTFRNEGRDEAGKQVFSVLDGQQRLSTISVLLDYLLYFRDDKPARSSLSFFESRLGFEENPMDSLYSSKSRYIGIYSFFMDCHLEMNYKKAEELLDIVLNRLFFLVHVSGEEEDPHEIFEGLNATGRNLEFSDLLLNALLEESNPEDTGAVKRRWEEVLKTVCGTQKLLFEEEEDDGVTQEEVEASPLKLKKFLNALNGMTLGENAPMPESVPSFFRMIGRLGPAGVFSNDVSDPAAKLHTLKKWGLVYRMIIDPVSSYDEVKKHAYARELYYLSLWNVTANIPALMRILYRNLCIEKDAGEYYSDRVVKNLLKTVLCTVVHTRIILNRLHSDDRNVENKIRYLDHLFDAYREIKNTGLSFGEDFGDMFPVIEELPEIMTEMSSSESGRAEDAVRSFQYTSSGSKFLLSLYADAGDPSGKSRVLELEAECGVKAQVEHMVSQNLCEGSFSDYGYDVGSIGLPDNLILLSGNVNRSIGDDTPPQKYSAWKADPFGGLFIDRGEGSFAWTDLRKTQKSKVDRIVNEFTAYFRPDDIPEDAKPLKNFTFARKTLKNGRTEQISRMAAPECRDGNSGERFVRIRNGVLEEHPKTVRNTVEGYWIPGRDGFLEAHLQSDDGEETFSYEILKAFLERLDDAENIYRWLKECEETIEGQNAKITGSNTVRTPKGKLFTYSQKMIHTDFLQGSSLIRNVMGRAEDKKQTHILLSDGRKIFLSNDFSVHARITELQKLYANYDAPGRKSFGFLIRRTNKIPVFIGNTLIQTEYVNIGDYGIYCDFIRNCGEYSDIFRDGTEKGISGKPSSLPAEVESYFEYETLLFQDLVFYYVDMLRIPEYQRSYVWDESNWEALYQRIRGSMGDGKELFLGTIVLRKENDLIYIVDGQQRLTTLTGFYAATHEGAFLPPALLSKVPSGIARFLADKDDIADFDCSFDVIYITGPREYQYEVFSSINSAGKKLTEEEKIANFLFSRYKNGNRKPEELKEIADNPGFAKAFCESSSRRFCENSKIYLTFRQIIENTDHSFEKLKYCSDVYSYIKGKRGKHIFGAKESYPVWLKLYDMLEVSTADAFLLSRTIRILSDGENLRKYESFESLVKKVCILYFLLYVMDRSGNAKKSADTNFLRCIDLPEQSFLAATVVNSQADLPYWNQSRSEGIAEIIWDQYVTTLSIYDIGQARIKRFILLMLEYLMIDEPDHTRNEWEKNADDEEELDIEHIFPASEKKWPKGRAGLIAASRLNYLENVMLLESSINKKIRDNMLIDKDRGKLSGYEKSRLFMARMLCGMKREDKSVYDKAFADERTELLKKAIVPNMEKLLSLVLKDSHLI